MMPAHRPDVKSSKPRRPEKPSMRVKDGRKQPFVWFPPELLPQYGAAMGAYAGWVYMSLLTHLNRKQGSCYLSHETIASETGMSTRQVRVSLKKLTTLGLIGITIRRPKVNIYEVFELPECPVNTQDMPIDPPVSNRHVVPVNRQDIPINRHVVPIQQARGAYEPEVVVPEVEDQRTTTTTRAAPKSSNVVEVVAPLVASAHGEETKTTDGFMVGTVVTPFDEFFAAYPDHRSVKKAQAEWDRQQLDVTLPTILEALSWQHQLTGHAALPLYAHVYLENKGWLDQRPVVAWLDWADDKTHKGPPCKSPGCAGTVPGALSDTRCDEHAMGYLNVEATEALSLLRRCPDDATFDVLESAIWGLVDQYHSNGGATAVREMIVGIYQDISEGQLTSVFLAQEIGRVVAKHRAKPRLAVMN